MTAAPRAPRAPRTVGRALALAALTLVGAACGYSTGLTVPEEHGTTIGIEFFNNRTPEPDIEREFHEQLSRAVIDLVHAPLVPPDQADYVIRGTMLQFSRRGGVRTIENELQETGLMVSVQGGLWRRRLPDEPPPPEPGQQSDDGRRRFDYDSRRGLTYERDFTDQPVLGSTYDPDWIEVQSGVAAPWVGYIVGDVGAELEARRRALRNAADRLVLDLFVDMN